MFLYLFRLSLFNFLTSANICASCPCLLSITSTVLIMLRFRQSLRAFGLDLSSCLYPPFSSSMSLTSSILSTSSTSSSIFSSSPCASPSSSSSSLKFSPSAFSSSYSSSSSYSYISLTSSRSSLSSSFSSSSPSPFALATYMSI